MHLKHYYKVSGDHGISAELFQILKDHAFKSDALRMPTNLENSEVATGLEKVSFHSNAKECSDYHTNALISHASKAMLKNHQMRLQQYVN